MSFDYPSFTEPRQIRLLKASFDQTQPDSDSIQCDFLVVNLDDLPCEYIAISYLWGSSEKPQKVWCDGFSIDVTVSAMSVLHMAALNPALGYIWIDALCIDQGNVSEKAVQIRLMRDVYSTARWTIAWLGDATPSTDEAMDFITTLRTALEKLQDENDDITQNALVNAEGCQHPSSGWTALISLLEHAYFRRVWILQEMVLASQVDIICGKRGVPWLELAYIVLQLGRHALGTFLIVTEDGVLDRRPRGLSSLSTAWGLRHFRENVNPVSLSTLLLYCWTLEASDDRDRVFALLGMADDAEDSHFEPDYNTTPSEVFVKSAARLLTRDRSSNTLLHGAGIGLGRNMESLPSWVPDWTKPNGTTVFGAMATKAQYHASGDRVPSTNALYDEDQQSLTLAGCIVDEITGFAPPYVEVASQPGPEAKQRVAAAIVAWLDDLQALCKLAGSHSSGLSYHPDILWRTIVAGSDCVANPAPASFRQNFLDFVACAEISAGAVGDDANTEASLEFVNSVEQFVAAMSTVATRRRVFATRLGCLGLGPLGIKVGDRICVFLGFNTPFVIRPRDGGGYLLVGECYIYGLMNGEALVDGKVEDITLY
ncbi:heterokaryon incompatibility protein-domain-containing protein [Rhexocercosporidium sp. MPI-PUGE-AT-0058]|nr:heterokaryon incompatibility protein-domain-containing protein [Rhexocercosporidium sp. MPI-PUGE-AT-0058]